MQYLVAKEGTDKPVPQLINVSEERAKCVSSLMRATFCARIFANTQAAAEASHENSRVTSLSSLRLGILGMHSVQSCLLREPTTLALTHSLCRPLVFASKGLRSNTPLRILNRVWPNPLSWLFLPLRLMLGSDTILLPRSGLQPSVTLRCSGDYDENFHVEVLDGLSKEYSARVEILILVWWCWTPGQYHKRLG